jgi:hypothetical protein
MTLANHSSVSPKAPTFACPPVAAIQHRHARGLPQKQLLEGRTEGLHPERPSSEISFSR